MQPAPPNYPLKDPKHHENKDHKALDRGLVGGPGLNMILYPEYTIL